MAETVRIVWEILVLIICIGLAYDFGNAKGYVEGISETIKMFEKISLQEDKADPERETENDA